MPNPEKELQRSKYAMISGFRPFVLISKSGVRASVWIKSTAFTSHLAWNLVPSVRTVLDELTAYDVFTGEMLYPACFVKLSVSSLTTHKIRHTIHIFTDRKQSCASKKRRNEAVKE